MSAPSIRRAGAVALLPALASCAESPSFMRPAGESAGQVAWLGWILTGIASVVVLVVIVLVLVGTFRRSGERPDGAPLAIVRSGDREGIRWVWVGGIAVPIVILTFAFVLTSVTMAKVTRPAVSPGLTIEVTGHRWWWEARYQSSEPTEVTTTANEIHVPVGRPVRLRLASADVIHSFWIPELAGKTDLIPGLNNEMWLKADRPGVYRGQCGEYCGLQHAKMAVYVVADPPAVFDAWLARQRQPARPAATPGAALGERVFRTGPCMSCHTIRGTDAMGTVGPDLTHFGSRHTLAAGVAPNTPGYLAGWISDAQGMKPGSGMPTMSLPPVELQALVVYLESLK